MEHSVTYHPTQVNTNTVLTNGIHNCHTPVYADDDYHVGGQVQAEHLQYQHFTQGSVVTHTVLGG